jgi:NTP pyrophosphatase (non-canonical NTP hydrolase)
MSRKHTPLHYYSPTLTPKPMRHPNMKPLYLDGYQTEASVYAIYPTHQALFYTALALGEAGEYQGKISKVIRDDGGRLTTERREECIDELGDCLWALSECARALGANLSEVASRNLEKLSSRKKRGVIGGSGDNR